MCLKSSPHTEHIDEDIPAHFDLDEVKEESRDELEKGILTNI